MAVLSVFDQLIPLQVAQVRFICLIFVKGGTFSSRLAYALTRFLLINRGNGDKLSGKSFTSNARTWTLSLWFGSIFGWEIGRIALILSTYLVQDILNYLNRLSHINKIVLDNCSTKPCTSQQKQNYDFVPKSVKKYCR